MKRLLVCVLIICMLLSLAACWSAEEPSDLGIINSIVYDLDEEENFVIVAQVINTAGIGGNTLTSSSGEKNPFVTVRGVGTSPANAVYNMTSMAEKSVFAAHNKVRFVSERLASNELKFKTFLDYINRDHYTDESVLMVIINNEDIDKVYKSTIGLATLPGDFVEDLHNQQQQQSSRAIFMRTFEFLRECHLEGKESVLGRLQFIPTEETPSQNPGGEIKDAKYQVLSEGLAFFKGFKMAGMLNGEDTEIYNILTNNSRVMRFDLNEDQDIVSVILVKPKTEIKVTKGGEQLYVNIKVKATMALRTFYVNGVTEANYKERLKEITPKAEEHLAKKTYESVQKVLEMGSDIYGFGKSLHEQSPKVWREIANDWDKYFKNAIVTVSYDLIFNREGESDIPFVRD
ncbi:MAG TPA: Ger(x)C family spore germination protein [Clostridia bacterium]|nr:Ger(x)C family spore germination protein [Clostridia bacterium]